MGNKKMYFSGDSRTSNSLSGAGNMPELGGQRNLRGLGGAGINKLAHIGMNRFNQILFIGLTILIMSSCNTNHKFDSEKWNQKGIDWWMTNVREKMVDDLIQSDTLKGMDEEQVINLLGQPESKKDGELEYLIREKYRYDIDPEYISNLIIEFDINEKVSGYKIEK